MTSALTYQVVPKSRLKVTRLRVSRSKNAAPRTKKWRVKLPAGTRAVSERTEIQGAKPLSVVVVEENEDATGREMVARRRERLLREEERFQTQVRRRRDEGEGVGLREDDEVESVGRAAKEVATVVDR